MTEPSDTTEGVSSTIDEPKNTVPRDYAPDRNYEVEFGEVLEKEPMNEKVPISGHEDEEEKRVDLTENGLDERDNGLPDGEIDQGEDTGLDSNSNEESETDSYSIASRDGLRRTMRKTHNKKMTNDEIGHIHIPPAIAQYNNIDASQVTKQYGVRQGTKITDTQTHNISNQMIGNQSNPIDRWSRSSDKRKGREKNAAMSNKTIIRGVFVGLILVSLFWTLPIAIDISDLLTNPQMNDVWLDIPNTYETAFHQDIEAIRKEEQSKTALSDDEEDPIDIQTAEPHSDNNNNNNNNGKTLSLLYPTGMLGGYRNQAMRFMGLLRHAVDQDYHNILLPTLVWSTRYPRKTKHLSFNPVVKAWPIPFDEVFDVDYWNAFHGSDFFSLPKLVFSVDESSDNDDDDEQVCWKPQTDDSIVSVEAVQAKNSTFTETFLPLLTQRMLFGNANNNNHTTTSARKAFLLEPVQAEAMEFLTGNTMAKKMHKVDVKKNVKNCTQPYVFGGKAHILWNTFLDMVNTIKKAKRAQRGDSQKKKAKVYTKLIEMAEQALVPAKPWRILADQCVEHHLGLGASEFEQEEEDPHVVSHDHGYIALHSRVEPEMLTHRCGKEMEQDLAKILDLTELLALDYNSPDGLPESARRRAQELNYTSPIGDALRLNLNTHDPRPLKGAFVAVNRDELYDVTSWPELANITQHNIDVLNQRSISYDEYGNQTYSKKLQEFEQYQPTNTHRRLTAENNYAKNNNIVNSTRPLPIFECGEGWVRHAFYESEARQKKLFTPSSSLLAKKDYGLYSKYGQDVSLPQDYFGDLLPSMLNFWLAVRADVFVGVRKSSWSTDVWRARYYMGKGSKNFEYTTEKGILAIKGLPDPHKNCEKSKKSKSKNKNKNKK